MEILQVEDRANKVVSVHRVLRALGIPNNQHTHVKYLNEAKELLLKNKYDIIITDMWYQEKEYAPEDECGLKLLDFMADNKIDTPVIIFSSAQYRDSRAVGCIKFSRESDWETEMFFLIKSIK